MVYCFLFMEETNYDRPARSAEDNNASATVSEVKENGNEIAPDEKLSKQAPAQDSTKDTAADSETGQVLYPRKTYIQKLGVKDKSRPNRILDIALGGLTGFSYPSVFYAG